QTEELLVRPHQGHVRRHVDVAHAVDVLTDVEVEVDGRGRSAEGVGDRPQHLTLFDGLSHRHRDVVAVEVVEARAVGRGHVHRVTPDVGDGAGRGGDHGVHAV